MREPYVKLEMPKSKYTEYSCPTCKTYPNDNEIGYKVKGIQYPKYFNRHRGSTPNGNFDNWDEVHWCKKCKQEFYFENGGY